MQPPLLLLHGALGSHDQIKPLANKLSSDFTVFTPDLLGHGNDPLPKEKLSVEEMAKKVLDYLDQNNIDRINLFGYSLGGYVGLYLAKHYPERINKIFSLAAKLHWDEAIAKRETSFLNAKKIEEKVPKFKQLLEKRHGDKWADLLNKVSEMMIDLGQNQTLENLGLSEITHQVCIAIGDRDETVTLDECINAYKSLSNGKLLVIPDTKHPFEQVSIDFLSQELKRFFEKD